MHLWYLAAILAAIFDLKKKLGSSIHPLVLGTRQYVLAKNEKNDFKAIFVKVSRLGHWTICPKHEMRC